MPAAAEHKFPNTPVACFLARFRSMQHVPVMSYYVYALVLSVLKTDSLMN